MKYYNRLFEMVKGLKIKEIPFWRIQTNGGLAKDNLRFWVGKTFMKQIVLKLVQENQKIFYLRNSSQNQIDLKKALIEYCQNFIDLLELDVVSFYFPNCENFMSFQILPEYYDILDWECIKYLRYYAQLKIDGTLIKEIEIYRRTQFFQSIRNSNICQKIIINFKLI